MHDDQVKKFPQNKDGLTETRALYRALCYRKEKLSIVNKFSFAFEIKAVTRGTSHGEAPSSTDGNENQTGRWATGHTYLVGDFKLTTSTLYHDYIEKRNIDQFNAIRSFAKKHTKSHTAVFLVLSKDPKLSAAENKVQIQYMKKLITARLLRKGVIGGVYVIRD